MKITQEIRDHFNEIYSLSDEEKAERFKSADSTRSICCPQEWEERFSWDEMDVIGVGDTESLQRAIEDHKKLKDKFGNKRK